MATVDAPTYRTENNVGRKKRMTGTVTSDKCNKTRRVEVRRAKRHAKYGKTVRYTKKYAVHDEHNVSKVGDVVEIVESRPYSKTKRWEISKILSSAQPLSSKSAFCKTETPARVTPKKTERPQGRKSSLPEIKEHRMADSAGLQYCLTRDQKIIVNFQFWRESFLVTTRWHTTDLTISDLTAFSTSLPLPPPWSFSIVFPSNTSDATMQSVQAILGRQFRLRPGNSNTFETEIDSLDSVSFKDHRALPAKPLGLSIESSLCDLRLIYNNTTTIQCTFFPLAKIDNLVASLVNYFPVTEERLQIASTLDRWCRDAAVECNKELDAFFDNANI